MIISSSIITIIIKNKTRYCFCLLYLIFSDMAPNASGNHTINHEAILVK